VTEARAIERDGAPALAAEGVSFSFSGRPVLDDVSLSVPRGRFCVLLGANGAGKTTFFSLATRLYHCPSGTIRILGSDIRDRPLEALASVGVVFQQPTLDLDLSVTQNLMYFAALQGLDRRDARRRVETELERHGLTGRAADKVRDLSGGQRRRVELSRALLHEPRLLLLDEPSVGLDVRSRHGIIQHVRELCRESGVGVLWATHLIDEVDQDDRLVVLHTGKVVFAGDVEEFLRATGTQTVHDGFVFLTEVETE